MIYDISMQLHDDLAVYGNNPIKKVHITKDFLVSTHGYEESHLNMNLHNGTHIDAPRHMIDQGETTEIFPLDIFYGNATVVDMMHAKEVITAKDIQDVVFKANDFVLFKTTNSLEDFFNPKFVYLAADAALKLVQAGVRGVGIDGLGIERGQSGHPTHLMLMNQRIVILEGVRLAHVPAGEYLISAFPLSIKHVDAAPVRAVLITK